jgi:hypothetical protein
MARMRRLLQWLAMGSFLGGGMAVGAAEPSAGYDSLLANSPFGQRPAGPDAGASNTPLEWRGVFVDHGETFFSLYDPSSRAARWVGLNEAGNPFTVRRYDAAKGTATVEYQGRELLLVLRQAKVLVSAPAAPAAGPTAVPGSGPGPQPANAAGANSEEAKRLAAIAEEIGRRRALRQKPATPVLPGPPAGPLPETPLSPGPNK